jgi:transposase
MLFVKSLTPVEIETLENLHKNHPCHMPRLRAHIVLLSYRGYSISEIQPIYNLCRQTIATCFHRWESQGICGLFDLPRSGRPRKLTETEETLTLELIHQSPRSLKSVMGEIAQKFGITLTVSTLKGLCKRAGLSWKRIRKSLKSKRDPVLFERSQQQLESLIQQAKSKQIDLFYFDESGFTLEPCVPYAWQTIGETLEIPTSKSKRLNVLGFVNRACQFDSMVVEGSVTSAVVVACIDRFAETLHKPTVLVIDNAPTHTSQEFNDNIERWKQRGLTIQPIARYSPELNIIEIVWRRIKYEWLPFSAYDSYENLKNEVFNVLASIGTDLKIEFA